MTVLGQREETGTDPREQLGAIERLEQEWRRHPVRDDRINHHLAGLVARAHIAGGRVLEIGGREYPRGGVFPEDRFTYDNMDIVPEIASVVGDITSCPELPDASYDVIVSVDVFEHLKQPWLAAAEIKRLLAPGGLVYTSTLFSWRYHPCPVDFWRYTPEALKFLFEGLVVLECDFDLTERRRDIRKKSKEDPMPIDALGGWRENVRVFHAAIKRA